MSKILHQVFLQRWQTVLFFIFISVFLKASTFFNKCIEFCFEFIGRFSKCLFIFNISCILSHLYYLKMFNSYDHQRLQIFHFQSLLVLVRYLPNQVRLRNSVPTLQSFYVEQVHAVLFQVVQQ